MREDHKNELTILCYFSWCLFVAFLVAGMIGGQAGLEITSAIFALIGIKIRLFVIDMESFEDEPK